MSEGPTNFGKPILWLVILGCAGGGYYAYTHWPVTYEGAGWTVKLPNKWEVTPANDPSDTTKIVGRGPLAKTPDGLEQEGVMWGKLAYHGTLDWNSFVRDNVSGTIDWSEDVEIDYKKARLYMYEEKEVRWYGVAVDRGDAMVFVAAGCNKNDFPLHQEAFEKIAKSLRCQR